MVTTIPNENNSQYSRLSVTYMFFTFGLLSSTWIVRIPDIQSRFSLSKDVLGLILTGGPIGSIFIMLFLGSLISHFGSKKTTIMGALLIHLSLPIISLMPNYISLWVFLIFFGIAGTTLDVSMNAQGVLVEKRLKTAIISTLHAFFSVGGVVGSLMGGILVHLGASITEHFTFVSVIFLPISFLAFKYLTVEGDISVNNHPEQISNNKKRKTRNLIRFPPKTIWLLGLIGFIAVLAEMMMSDWSLIYILSYTNVDPSFAALGFAVFSLFMTLGRLTGDYLSNRFSLKMIVNYFSILASVGILLAISTNNIVLIFIGFGLLGIGLSVIVPIIFKLGGNQKNIEVGTGVAGVMLFVYAALLIEPIFIGQLSELISLKFAFGLVAVFAIFTIFISKTIPNKIEN